MSAGAQRLSSGIAGRIVRAAGAQGMVQLARIAQMFLLVPICLGAWGTAVYEDWILVYSITAFLVLADLGFVQFTTVKLIEAWSKGDSQRFSREWAIALGLFAALSATLTCVVVLSWFEPGWTSVIPARQLREMELISLAALLSLAQVCSILITLGLAAYRARGDLSRSYHVWTILLVLQTGGIVLPAVLGRGPVGAAAGNLIATCAVLTAVAIDVSLRYPDMGWKPVWPSFGELSRRVREAVGYLVSPVAITMMVNGPNLILAHSGAPQGSIALFTATRTIAGVARQLPYQFAHPAGVELASMMAREDREGLFRLYESASRALAVIVGALSGFTVIAASLVMALWTRGRIAYDPGLMFFFVGATSLCAPAQVAYTFLWYGGYPSPLNKALIFSTAVAFGLAILFARWFGARGVAAGLGVGETVGIAVYLSLLVDRLLERKPGAGLVRNFSISLLSFLASAATGYVIRELIEPRGWVGLVEFAFAWGLPGTVGAYWILLSRSQRARLNSRAASALRFRRARSCFKSANPADLG